MDTKTRRKHLNDYSTAHTDIVLTDVAITILESVTGMQRVISALKISQQKHLSRLDAAAEKLGAPYPTAKRNSADGAWGEL